MITGLYELLDALLRLFTWALVLQGVLSILDVAGVIDSRNRMVQWTSDFLYRVTNPVLRPIRNVLPFFGNVDLSPIVAILVVQYLARPLLFTIYRGILTGEWTFIY